MMNESLSRRSFVMGMAGVAATAGLAACGGSGSSDKGADSSSADGDKASYKVQMVTDTGGVNDQSFNQISWSGLQQLEEQEGWEVGYLESKQESDYKTNLDKCVDDGANLICGVGFAMAEAVGTAAKTYPDVKFAIIDNANPTGSANLTGVQFRAQEPSFMVGYIAACTSTTGKVGFVGGVASDVISLFEFGYRGGVAYANSVKGTNVEVQAQYAESFSDSAKGKAIASSMFSNGCDVVFHAAGGVGTGVIEAAKDAGKFAIGVDMDQSSSAATWPWSTSPSACWPARRSRTSPWVPPRTAWASPRTTTSWPRTSTMRPWRLRTRSRTGSSSRQGPRMTSTPMSRLSGRMPA